VYTNLSSTSPFFSFFVPGKILLSGEYALLEGSVGAAMVSKFGQYLTLTSSQISSNLSKDYWLEFSSQREQEVLTAFINPSTWECVSEEKKWHEACSFFKKNKCSLHFYLQEYKNQNKDKNKGLKGNFHCNFNLSWGLGSSSSWICLLSYLIDFNPYDLNSFLFKGSGYDIAVGLYQQDLLFSKPSHISLASFPLLSKKKYQEQGHAFFAFMGKKISSQQSLEMAYAQNKKRPLFSQKEINLISSFSRALSFSSRIEEWMKILQEQDLLLSFILGRSTLQHSFFSDFPGTIRPLGAWGGDLVLGLTTQTDKKFCQRYCEEKKIGYLNIEEILPCLLPD